MTSTATWDIHPLHDEEVHRQRLPNLAKATDEMKSHAVSHMEQWCRNNEQLIIDLCNGNVDDFERICLLICDAARASVSRFPTTGGKPLHNHKRRTLDSNRRESCRARSLLRLVLSDPHRHLSSRNIRHVTSSLPSSDTAGLPCWSDDARPWISLLSRRINVYRRGVRREVTAMNNTINDPTILLLSFIVCSTVIVQVPYVLLLTLQLKRYQHHHRQLNLF